MNVNDIIKLIVVLAVAIAFLAVVLADPIQGRPIQANVITAVISIFTAVLGAGGSIGLIGWGEQRAMRAVRSGVYPATSTNK